MDDLQRIPLIIKYTFETDYVRCALCPAYVSVDAGPALFRENGGPVCNECGMIHAPELVAVLPQAQRLYVEACSHLWSRPSQMD